MFLLMLLPAFLFLLVGLLLSRSGHRGACARLWAHSLVVSNISAYLAVSPHAPGIWLALALGAPLICVIFALYSRVAQSPGSQSVNLPRLRQINVALLSLSLVPIFAIVIAKFQMTQLDARAEQCKQAIANELLANNGANQRQKIKLICSAPNGFIAPMVASDSLAYTGRLVGQQVFFEARKHENVVHWECHVYPKLFGNRSCEGYEIVWH